MAAWIFVTSASLVVICFYVNISFTSRIILSILTKNQTWKSTFASQTLNDPVNEQTHSFAEPNF